MINLTKKEVYWPFFSLIIFFLIGTFLRFHQLGEESIWVDEAFSYHYFILDWPDLIDILKNDVHPLLFYAFGHGWTEAFGTSEISLRFLPFLFGSFSLILLFLLGREIYGNKTALLSTLFFSLSYTFILYSQEAKMYSQFIFFFLLVGWLYFRFVKNPNWTNTVLLSVSNGLLLHTHILSFVVIFFEFVWYYFCYYLYAKQKINLWEERFSKVKAQFSLKFNCGVGLTVLFYSFWLPVFYYQFRRLFLDMLPFKFQEKFGFNGFYAIFLVLAAFLILFLIVLFYLSSNRKIVLKVSGWAKRISIKDYWVIALFLLWVGVNLFWRELFFGNLFYIRYTLFLFPVFYLFVSHRLLQLKSKPLFYLLMLVYFIGVLVILPAYYSLDSKEQWRETAAYISTNADASRDLILFHTAGHTWWAFNYYYSGNITQIRMNKVQDWSLAPEKISQSRYTYLVLSHNYQTKEWFKQQMDQSYQLVESKELVGIKIYKYTNG